jgi:outer membrane murein-binding lipoprotein Lpp
MNTLARRAALAASLLVAGCCGPDRQRIAADRATYDWFGPMMVAYLAADTKLDEAAKATYLRGLRAWKDRLDADAAAVR